MDAKLKIKFGDHEFEAEGPSELVQSQFELFRKLVESAPPPVATPPLVGGAPMPPTQEVAPITGKMAGELMLGRIMRHEGRVVSLTARGSGLEDEILLILLGQRNLRSNDSVSGAEIMDGLRLTGRTVNRIDYQIDKMTQAGDVITVGNGRARRYRMTNQGLAKAQELAMDLIQTVA